MMEIETNSKIDDSGFHENVKIHGHHAACMADLVIKICLDVS